MLARQSDKLLPKPERLLSNIIRLCRIATCTPFGNCWRTPTRPAARALETVIYTGLRTAEVIGAKWTKSTSDAGVWTVPAARMKMKKQHRVPLSAPAVRVLRTCYALRVNDYVFPVTEQHRRTPAST